MLPFAGITQIRFEGVSHPAITAARTPSVCCFGALPAFKKD